MDGIPFTVGSATSAVLALRQTAWELGFAISKLNNDAYSIGTSARHLADQVQSLRTECDLLHSELEVIHKNGTGSGLYNDSDNTMWHCITTHAQEAQQTTQELGSLIQSTEEGRFRRATQGNLESSRAHVENIIRRICRHTNIMRTTHLLIAT